MALRFSLIPCAIAILAGLSGNVRSQPLQASLRPDADKRPTQQLEAGPNETAASVLIGLLDCVTLLGRGRIAKGEEACSKVIALDAGNATAYKLRGYGYLLEHRFERAAADFQISLRLAPRDAESLAGYGQSLSGLGKFEAAVTQFTRAIALAPKASTYWSARCWARAGSGRQLGLALADCDRALALSPAAAVALNDRGMVRLRMGQFQAAILDYSKSLARDSQQPSARFGRGVALLHLGRSEAAASDIARARQADPEIDALFVLMGVLPHDCAHPGKAICPPPPLSHQKPVGSPWIMALTNDADGGLFDAVAGRLRPVLARNAPLRPNGRPVSPPRALCGLQAAQRPISKNTAPIVPDQRQAPINAQDCNRDSNGRPE